MHLVAGRQAAARTRKQPVTRASHIRSLARSPAAENKFCETRSQKKPLISAVHQKEERNWTTERRDLTLYNLLPLQLGRPGDGESTYLLAMQ